MHWDANFENGTFFKISLMMVRQISTSLYLAHPTSIPRWFNNFNYTIEQYRGLDYSEDLFNHGTFSVSLKKGDSIGIIISTEDPAGRNAHELFQKENM